MAVKIGRNDLCICGSGKKYKKCCINKEDSKNVVVHKEIESFNDAEIGEEYDDLSFIGSNNYKIKNIIKGYILTRLDYVISMIKSENNNIEKICSIAGELYKIAIENGNSFYYKYTLDYGRYQSMPEKLYLDNVLAERVNELNLTERIVIKQLMLGVIMEREMINGLGHDIDFGAISVVCEAVRDMLFKGLEDKKIDRITFNVGYKDKLNSVEVVYGKERYKDINEDTIIFPIWNTDHELYHNYAIYKTNFPAFEESSITTLATAAYSKKAYEDQEEGMELISYNGIALNYLTVFEYEIKRCATKIGKHLGREENWKKLTLKSAIEILKEESVIGFEEEERIEKIEKIRMFRNKVAHGITVTYEEIKEIERILFNMQVFETISFAMKDIDSNI